MKIYSVQYETHDGIESQVLFTDKKHAERFKKYLERNSNYGYDIVTLHINETYIEGEEPL